MSNVPADKKMAPGKESLSRQISDSIQGKDEPMEVSHPDAPPLLVFASYPIVLVLGIILALVAFWMYST